MKDSNHILADITRRQYPLPERSWKYYQEWHNVVMMHWSVVPEILRELLPKGLDLDLHNGKAWISLISFSVKNLRHRFFPVFASIPEFEEINLRTYVIRDGKPGIYIFSAETQKRLIVVLTRIFVGIPYIKSDIDRIGNCLIAENDERNFRLTQQVMPKNPITIKMDIDYWLTERYCLYVLRKNKLYRHDIHHREWKLNKTDISLGRLRYRAGRVSVEDTKPELKHYSKKIRVLLWGRRKLLPQTTVPESSIPLSTRSGSYAMITGKGINLNQ